MNYDHDAWQRQPTSPNEYNWLVVVNMQLLFWKCNYKAENKRGVNDVEVGPTTILQYE